MIRSFFVRASSEARQKALRRMLTQNPKVRIRLTEGQKRALAQRSAAANQASRLADLLRTLGDPTRLRVLTALDGVGVPVTAIVEATGVRQQTVSHHLRILRPPAVTRCVPASTA